MTQCAWCQKETQKIARWSKDKEPLCYLCEDKYQFGLVRNLIPEKVSDLTKEQRYEISNRWHTLSRFQAALYSVEKEVLDKKGRAFSHILGWGLALLVLTIYISSSDWSHNYIFRVVRVIGVFYLVILAAILHSRLVWFLKLWQLKKESEYR